MYPLFLFYLACLFVGFSYLTCTFCHLFEWQNSWKLADPNTTILSMSNFCSALPVHILSFSISLSVYPEPQLSLWTSLLINLYIYTSKRFSLISQVQYGYCILRKANNPCYHNRARFYFSSCSTCMKLLLIQSPVDFSEASSVPLVSFPFIIWTMLLSLPCCWRMSHDMSLACYPIPKICR